MVTILVLILGSIMIIDATSITRIFSTITLRG